MGTVPLLRVVGISKRYGAVNALNGVSLEVRAGEVIALCGDNGAGKSTVVSVISGNVRPNEGHIEIDGVRMDFSSPRAASEAGIATVYQDLALCTNLDVVSNLYLGRELAHPPLAGELRRLDVPEMHRIARETLDKLAITMPDLTALIASLSGGQRQAVAVARAILWGSTYVLLDEPTAALGVEQTANVLRLVRTLAERGVAVMLISHSMPNVFAVADKICVLRLGSVAGLFDRHATSQEEVVRAITGGQGGVAA